MVWSALTFGSWPSSLLSPLPCEGLMIGWLSCSKTCPPIGTPTFPTLPLPQGDLSLNSPDGRRMVFRK